MSPYTSQPSGRRIEGSSDYESGSWTPVLEGATTAGTQTYSLQAGRYIKLGPLVWVSAALSLSAFDVATSGNMRITGLPFSVSNIAGLTTPLSVSNLKAINLDVAGGFYFPLLDFQKGSSYINMSEGGDNVTPVALTEADFGNTSAIKIAGTYSTGLS